MDLVIDEGSEEIKLGFFEADQLKHAIRTTPKEILSFLKDKKIENILIGTKDTSNEITTLLASAGYPCQSIDIEDFPNRSTAETKPLLRGDKVANIYAALSRFPSNDCVVVDLGRNIRFDCITKQGVYVGGSTFPGFSHVFNLLIKGVLHLEEAPFNIFGTTTLDQNKGGIYFGILGAVERIVSELRLSFSSPGSVVTLATGGPTRLEPIKSDLNDFIDLVDPNLTLLGLHQILKEKYARK